MLNPNQSHLGLSKTLFNSAACLINSKENQVDIELILSERILRKKACGNWPVKALKYFGQAVSDKALTGITENRDVIKPGLFEQKLNIASPFYDYLKKEKLEHLTNQYNSRVEFINHHLAHAYSCLAICPYEESIIFIMDGAGSLKEDIPLDSIDNIFPKTDAINEHEEYSVYLQKGSTLKCIEKGFQVFDSENKVEGHTFSEGMGILYEKAAEFIFNSKQAAGKVMGLAPFGTVQNTSSLKEYLMGLDWKKASFKGHCKKTWESSEHLSLYKDIAATVQFHFEKVYLNRIIEIQKKHPSINNLILAGGTALNCVANKKVMDKSIYKNIFVPPFPGDEGISLGLAYYSFLNMGNSWTPMPLDKQHGYFGPKKSLPTDSEVSKYFKNYKLTKTDNMAKDASVLLEQGKIIAWYQGRSESGPRALGNRSILAKVDYPGLKNKLNREIKFREDFRPYGCSVLLEKAHQYFEVPELFYNLYMSFAISIKSEFKELFKEVCHIDGTSRYQSVSKSQNSLYHELIHEVGEKTGTYAVLNTSLNIMGEPIVEDLNDALNFFNTSSIDTFCIGNYIIEK